MKQFLILNNFVSHFSIILIFIFNVFSYPQADTQEEKLSFLDGLSVISGPQQIKMGQTAAIYLPENYFFLNASDTRILMERFQNPSSNNEEGLIANKDFDWFVVFEFSEVGYVPDDEKDQLDAEAMMEALLESNEEANKIREKNGWGKMTITGWEIKPHYNEYTNNLEWAIRGVDNLSYPVINHSTRLLGRKGVMELTLVVDPASYASVTRAYSDIIKTFTFQSGQKYAEYTEGDKVAEYGLTALVVGGGTAIAAKSGLLKYLWKIIVGVFIVGASFFKKIFGRFKKK